ncbi:MAG: histidine phosphatase family protein [Anaerolineae bacterium]
MQTIYLIRHAETAWTKTGQHTGLTDIPLTAEGQHQAKLLKQRLKDLKFQNVFTSPLKRAKETCQLADLFSQAEIDDDLVEWNYGDYEGLTREEIHKKDPGWSIFTKGAPGGESVDDVSKRADRVLEKIHHLKGSIAIFSSGHFSRVLAVKWLSLNPECGKLLALFPASLSILGYESNNPVLIRWNDISHLELK